MSSRAKNLVIVRSVIDQGLSLTEAAARFSVSRQWVHTLLTRYQLEGPAGLEPRSRAPRTHPGITPSTLREEIIRLRRELTGQGADAGPITIAWHLEHTGHRAPSTSTIRRILHSEGLIEPAPSKRPRSSYRRFEADLPNQCWQSDITHAYLASGRQAEALDFLDDHSRYLLHLQAAPAFTGKVDQNGKVTLRYAGRIRHLGIGRAHIGESVLMLICDTEVTTSNAATGEVIAEHLIDPTKNYQRPLQRTPGQHPPTIPAPQKTNPRKKA